MTGLLILRCSLAKARFEAAKDWLKSFPASDRLYLPNSKCWALRYPSMPLGDHYRAFLGDVSANGWEILSESVFIDDAPVRSCETILDGMALRTCERARRL